MKKVKRKEHTGGFPVLNSSGQGNRDVAKVREKPTDFNLSGGKTLHTNSNATGNQG